MCGPEQFDDDIEPITGKKNTGKPSTNKHRINIICWLLSNRQCFFLVNNIVKCIILSSLITYINNLQRRSWLTHMHSSFTIKSCTK